MGFLESIADWLLNSGTKEPFNASKDMSVVIVGFVLVLLALLLLCMLVYCFSLIFRKKPKAETATDTASEISQTDTFSSTIEISAISDEDSDDGELVAVLTAAIMSFCNSTSGTSPNLRITSYKRLGSNSPAWNRAGRTEQLDTSL